jgi:TolB protein
VLVWSADGQRLACEGDGQTDPSLDGIYTIQSSDGRGLTRITNAGGGHDIPIDYSPDGKQVLFSRTDPSATDICSDNKSALFVVNVDGSGLHQITPGGFCDDDGSCSPDGTKIAFEHAGALFVVRPDGTRLAKIPLAIGSHSFAGDFSWSPDGTKITFLLGTPTGEGIATANADGRNVQRVTISPTFDHQTDWGPHPPLTP